jgi:uncharacterized protein (TIGR03435 family)
VQKLLADRQLAFHRDKRELSVYALTVARTGPKAAKGSDRTACRRCSSERPRRAARRTWPIWPDSRAVHRPVVDQTGLAGRFDFTLT